MDQHVLGRVGPGLTQRFGVRDEVAVSQHRALGAPGGPRGVEQRREIVGRALDSREGFRGGVGRIHQAALALCVERDERGAGLVRDGLQCLAPARVADEDRRLGVADEVLYLGRVYPVLSGRKTPPARTVPRLRTMASTDFSTWAATRSPGFTPGRRG